MKELKVIKPKRLDLIPIGKTSRRTERKKKEKQGKERRNTAQKRLITTAFVSMALNAAQMIIIYALLTR